MNSAERANRLYTNKGTPRKDTKLQREANAELSKAAMPSKEWGVASTNAALALASELRQATKRKKANAGAGR